MGFTADRYRFESPPVTNFEQVNLLGFSFLAPKIKILKHTS